jgi:hypothetical protein
MRYRLTPVPDVAVYCQVTPGLPEVEFLGAVVLDRLGCEDARFVPPNVAAAAEAWTTSLPVEAMRWARPA